MRDQEHGSNGDEEGGETCSPPPVGCWLHSVWGRVVFLGAGEVDGRSFGMRKLQRQRWRESNQALWEHGGIWYGGSLQCGAELCAEADGLSSLVGGMEGCLEPENYHSFGGGLTPSR